MRDRRIERRRARWFEAKRRVSDDHWLGRQERRCSPVRPVRFQAAAALRTSRASTARARHWVQVCCRAPRLEPVCCRAELQRRAPAVDCSQQWPDQPRLAAPVARPPVPCRRATRRSYSATSCVGGQRIGRGLLGIRRGRTCRTIRNAGQIRFRAVGIRRRRRGIRRKAAGIGCRSWRCVADQVIDGGTGARAQGDGQHRREAHQGLGHAVVPQPHRNPNAQGIQARLAASKQNSLPNR